VELSSQTLQQIPVIGEKCAESHRPSNHRSAYAAGARTPAEPCRQPHYFFSSFRHVIAQYGGKNRLGAVHFPGAV